MFFTNLNSVPYPRVHPACQEDQKLSDYSEMPKVHYYNYTQKPIVLTCVHIIATANDKDRRKVRASGFCSSKSSSQGDSAADERNLLRQDGRERAQLLFSAGICARAERCSTRQLEQSGRDKVCGCQTSHFGQQCLPVWRKPHYAYILAIATVNISSLRCP